MNEDALRTALEALLASFDEWLGNSDGLMLEDVIAWREQLASAIGSSTVCCCDESDDPCPVHTGPDWAQ